MKTKLNLFICLILLFSISKIFGQLIEVSYDNDSSKYAGFRASRILSSYPDRQFPEPEYWEMVGNEMSNKFDGFQPGGLWIVSLYLSSPEGYTSLSFPRPYEGVYDSIIFRGTEQNEKYLSHFDTTGVKVWLQVEPGGANVDTLISLILNRYKQHECVKGFGIDVEWYKTSQHKNGMKVSDEEVEHWEQKVKEVDSSYTLFLKHFSRRWMPPNYLGDIIFIDDSQDFNWYSDPFTGMITEFEKWGREFYPNKVGFQFGYPLDQNWWGEFSDPAKEIGNKLIEYVPNIAGIYWVDFTVIDVFPPEIVNVADIASPSFVLNQNYPNPFNPNTKISFSLGESSEISLEIYDIKGSKIATFLDGYISSGVHEYNFDAMNLHSGIYLYRLKTSNMTVTKKMMLLK